MFADLIYIFTSLGASIRTLIPMAAGPGSVNLLSLALTVGVGLLAGSLVNYCADVLPLNRRLTRPVCQTCSKPYDLRHYLFALQCPYCGQKKSIRSLIVWIGAVMSCILLQYFPFARLSFWATLPILVFLGVVLVIDIEHHLVLFPVSLAGLVLFLIYGIFLHGFMVTLHGALAGLGVMLLLYLSGIAFAKIIGKLRQKEIDEVAFGFGDVMAGAFLGLLAGWPGIAGVILIAMITFAAFALVLLVGLVLTKRYHAFAHAQPFTPFLILGLITLFYL